MLLSHKVGTDVNRSAVFDLPKSTRGSCSTEWKFKHVAAFEQPKKLKVPSYWCYKAILLGCLQIMNIILNNWVIILFIHLLFTDIFKHSCSPIPSF